MADLLKAGLDPLILGLLDEHPDHGYSLMIRLQAITKIKVADGSLYPALYRLERAGAIAGTWHSDGKRRRKIFSLTSKGHRQLDRAKADWLEWVRALSGVFGKVAHVGGR